MIHELRVHQIELEMQNDELRNIQRDLEASRDRYSQLYHQAPVGYLTVDRGGVITEANQTLMGLLDVTGENLLGRPFVEILNTGDKKTVLIVDDEAMILEVCKQMLEGPGYAVMVVGSGEEAVELLSRNDNHIDLVLLDIIMPGITGGETFDRLKSINPDLKVLMASGYSLDSKAWTLCIEAVTALYRNPTKWRIWPKRSSQSWRNTADH